MRNNYKYGKELPELFNKIAVSAGDDACSIFLPLRKPNMEYLSKAAIESLDLSIKENVKLTFPQLFNKSHDDAWKKAWERKVENGDDRMPMDSIAKAAGADDAMLEYIKEQMEIDAALV